MDDDRAVGLIARLHAAISDLKRVREPSPNNHRYYMLALSHVRQRLYRIERDFRPEGWRPDGE